MKNEEQQVKYQRFMNWFVQNGGIYNKIKFPTQFSPIGYKGISAQQSIKIDEVFLAVPKTIIISVSKVRDSKIGEVFCQSQYLCSQQNDQIQYHLLVLYLIWQKQLGPDSFYYPYVSVLQRAQPIIRWRDQDIQKLNDPYITVDFVNYLRQELPKLLECFNKIASDHPELFKQQITEEVFMDCYASVMTRIFGWGLPQTMMVPFADFLNHNTTGVNHYTLNSRLQKQCGTYQLLKDYVQKKNQLDLTILQIPRQKQQLKQPDIRQKFIQKYKDMLVKSQDNLQSSKKQFQYIQKHLLQQKYDIQLCPSSNSQDNDSEQDDIGEEGNQKRYLRSLNKQVRQQLQTPFQQNKRTIDKQFDKGFNFDWWWKMNQKDSYFIVAANTNIQEGQQIFNSYGRRSNRFLLIWYGFTHINNKYDSITFRIWSGEVFNNTGRLLFTRYLTQRDWFEKIKLGNNRYSYHNLSDEYRLKRDNICYELMAFLRFNVVKKKKIFKQIKNKYKFHQIHNLQLEKYMLHEYLSVLSKINQIYCLQDIREQLSSAAKNWFANIFIESKRQIYANHISGATLLLNIINRLIEGQSLQQIYKRKENQLNNITFRQRRFIIQYLKLLSRFLNKDSQ